MILAFLAPLAARALGWLSPGPCSPRAMLHFLM